MLFAALLSTFLAFSVPVGALAQSVEQSDKNTLEQSQVEAVRPYIRQGAVDGTYRILVMGDSLGAGAWQGLYQNLKQDENPAFDVVQKAKVNTGIVRSDRLNWMEEVERLARTEEFQIAVLLFGGNDMQSIREKGKSHHYKTEGWIERYNERLDRIIVPLKEAGVAIYWMGLPIVKRPRLQDDYRYVNEIIAQKAEEHGIRFIETWAITADSKGRYSPSGETIKGKRAKLRARDGVHFNPAGYRRLARYVERMIRLDVETRAREEAKQKEKIRPSAGTQAIGFDKES